MAGRTVLVVDDDKPTRDALATRLGVEGYAVIEARNGREALDRLRETTPFIILLDYQMPVMDGRAFREAQKADARWAAIPVVLITAHHLTTVASRSLDALAILQKPVTYEMLAPLLARGCRREPRREREPSDSTSRRRRA